LADVGFGAFGGGANELERQLAQGRSGRRLGLAAVGFHSRWVDKANKAMSATLDLRENHSLDALHVVPAIPLRAGDTGFPAVQGGGFVGQRV